MKFTRGESISGGEARGLGHAPRLLFSLVLAATTFALFPHPFAAATPFQMRAGASQAVCSANSQPGADLGAKINACDAKLGPRPGEIRVSGGGALRTQVRLSDNRVLRFSAGVYANHATQTAIILGDDNAVVGDGWDTVLMESSFITKADPSKTPLAWTVIQTRADYEGGKTGVTRNVRVSDLKIQGYGAGPVHSTPQTIALGNCHGCTVERVWLNETRTIGVQVGGSSASGNYADGVTVRDNLFRGVGSQNIAVVNGQNVLITRNTVKTSGRSDKVSTQVIDVEPNVSTDRIGNIEISGNEIDVRESVIGSNNGIAFQNTVRAMQTKPSRIVGNKVIGGNNASNSWMPVGISLAGTTRDIEIADNLVQGTSGPAIVFYPGGGGHLRPRVSRNKIVHSGAGGGSSYAIEVGDTTGGVFRDNEIVQSTSVPGNGQLVETGSSSNSYYNTRYSGNTFAGLTLRPSSRQYGTIGNGVLIKP